MTPKLPDELWIYIFSYCEKYYPDLYIYSEVSVYFAAVVDKFIEVSKNRLYSRLTKYHPYDANDSFWNGIGNHFPVWNGSTKPRDLFVNHILMSLESFAVDQERADKIPLYLGKNKTFMQEHNFRDKFRQYEKSLQAFIWHNISNPVLYCYLELRRTQDSLIT